MVFGIHWHYRAVFQSIHSIWKIVIICRLRSIPSSYYDRYLIWAVLIEFITIILKEKEKNDYSYINLYNYYHYTYA